MAFLAAGVLVLDHYLETWLGIPFYPCLMLAVLLLIILSVCEVDALLDHRPRPPLALSLASCCAVVLACWPAQLGWTGATPEPWRDVALVLALTILLAFCWEMAVFREPGGVVERLGLLAFLTGYLGILPAFLVNLRWLRNEGGSLAGVTALALVIFVPKSADIGAYFTGRALGRHKMSPVLSPKKTLEGLAGGLALAALVAVLINRLVTRVLPTDGEAALFGLIVGGAGVLGDLAESLLKRDCGKKDASHAVPGFGGILDVVDSVLFAAPVAWGWLMLRG